MASSIAKRDPYRASLGGAMANGEDAMVVKFEQRIRGLEKVQLRHPDHPEPPSAFEVSCELNRSDSRCRIDDD